MASQVKYKLLSIDPNKTPNGDTKVLLLDTETNEKIDFIVSGFSSYPDAHIALVVWANFCLNDAKNAAEVVFNYTLNSIIKHDNPGMWIVTVNNDIVFNIIVDESLTEMDIIEQIAINGFEYVINNIARIPEIAYTFNGPSEGKTLSLKLFDRYIVDLSENAGQDINDEQLTYALCNATYLILMVEACYRNATSVSNVDQIEIISDNLVIPTVIVRKYDEVNGTKSIGDMANIVAINNLTYKLMGTDIKTIASVTTF